MRRARSLTPNPVVLAIALTFALAGGLLLGAPAPAGAQAQLEQAQAIQPVPFPDYCLAVVDPVPSGVTGRPNHNFSTYPDYNFVHSSTHLSGKRATEKFAAGLYWNPPAPLELSGMRSSIKVTNPDPTAFLTANVEFYDQGGALVGVVPVNLAAEASATVPASPLAGGTPAGLGSARIVSTNGVELVGETIHHTLSFDLGAYGGPVVTDPDPFNPGASSLQQLQIRQAAKTTLYMGPFPVSDQSPLDILNGNNPLFWIQNPNATPTTVNVAVVSRLGVSFGTTTVTLQPYASLLDLRLWSAAWPFYLSGSINYDDDFLVVVTANQGILGEFLMTDLFQNGAGPGNHLNLGGRFRMGSGMLSNSPALRVINPEFTYQPTNLGIETVMGVLNAGTTDIGPVNVQYRDRNGNVITSYNVASLPRGAMLRLGPGISPVSGSDVRRLGADHRLQAGAGRVDHAHRRRRAGHHAAAVQEGLGRGPGRRQRRRAGQRLHGQRGRAELGAQGGVVRARRPDLLLAGLHRVRQPRVVQHRPVLVPVLPGQRSGRHQPGRPAVRRSALREHLVQLRGPVRELLRRHQPERAGGPHHRQDRGDPRDR